MKNIYIFISDISKRAGTERAVSNLANILASSNDYKVNIISIESNSSFLPAYDLSDNITVTHLNQIHRKNVFSRCNRHLKTLKMFKKFTQLDNTVFIGTEFYINYLFCFISKKVRKIGCEHTNYDKPGLHHKILRKIFYPKLDAVVMLTKNDTNRYTFVKNRYTIPNSISFTTDSFPKYANKTFLAVGRLTYQKGYDMLLKAAQIIKKELPDWKINIYGEGEDYDTLIKLISNYNLNNYVFINKPVTDIKSVYANSSIYLLSSRFEGFAMVLLESQSVGMPAVAFNCPEGPSEIIKNSENGYLIDINDINSFAQKAIEIAKDETLWNKMSSNAIILSKRYTPDEIFILWDKLIKEVLER